MSEVERILGPSWARSDRIFSLIAPEGMERRAIPLRHPPIFYLGHLAAFAWNHVGAGLLGEDPHDPVLDELFERGIDPLTDQAAAGASVAEWPSIPDILAYRDAIRQRVGDVEDRVHTLSKSRAKKNLLAKKGAVYWLVREHEDMHHETLLYLLQQLDPRLLRRPRDWPRLETGADVRPPRRVPVKRGRSVLGIDRGVLPFTWDNENPRHEVEVDSFLLDDLPVTVGRFRVFVEAGGYANRDLWDDAAWDWLTTRGHAHPISWRDGSSGLEVRSLFAWHPIADVAGWPVAVSHAEARAYARWAGGRLPTEAELNRAAYVDASDEVRAYPWGEAPASRRFANLGFRRGGPQVVGQTPAGRGPWGHHELVGNLWEWTDTPFRPLPGFEPWIRTYPGYSSDFFDDQHYVVFGASWATADGLARRSFRNWYQGLYPYVFSGFRLAWD